MEGLGCPECAGPLGYLEDGDRALFACEDCGGMFDAPGLIESHIARAVEPLEPDHVLCVGYAPAADLESAAAAHGLLFGDSLYREVDRRTAVKILTAMLEAYRAPEPRAIAAAFVAPLAAAKMALYSNRRWNDRRDELSAAWTPATLHGLDGGILAVGLAGSAALFVGDDE